MRTVIRADSKTAGGGAGSNTAGSIRVGASSWSDSSLTKDSLWYPKKTMSATERIGFYCDNFDLVEMETTYRFPPTPALSQQWVDRTPDGFKMNLQAWSLLTEQPAFPPSLWEDLIPEVKEDRKDRPKLYMSHLSDSAVEECWQRFRYSIAPLVEANKLGTLILKYPRWFKPSEKKRDMLEMTRKRLGDLPAAVEFSAPEWLESQRCESTFAMLDDLDLGFVCVDAGKDNPRSLREASATTSDISVLRMVGRKTREPDQEWTPDWRGYLYTDEELQEILPRIYDLADGAKELHVIFSTCWRDDAVKNAQALQRLLVSNASTSLQSAS